MQCEYVILLMVFFVFNLGFPNQKNGWKYDLVTVLIGSGQSTLVLPKLKSKMVTRCPIKLTRHFWRPQLTRTPLESKLIPGLSLLGQSAPQSLKPRTTSIAISTRSIWLSVWMLFNSGLSLVFASEEVPSVCHDSKSSLEGISLEGWSGVTNCFFSRW